MIEINEETRTPEIINRIHLANKLVLENSWHFSLTREIFIAACKPLFKLNIDIAITDRVGSCLRQRDNYINK